MYRFDKFQPNADRPLDEKLKVKENLGILRFNSSDDSPLRMTLRLPKKINSI